MRNNRTILDGIPPIEGIYQMSLKEGNAKKPVYEMHKWWARRLGINFRFLLIGSTLSIRKRGSLLSSLYAKHDLQHVTVCDPFMGGGTSVVEASKLGMRTIGIDIDPVAWFVTKKEVDPFDENAFMSAYSEVMRSVKNRITEFYKTVLDDGRVAEVVYYFWVDLITCPSCGCNFEGHPKYELAHNEKQGIRTAFCRHCHQVRTIRYNQKWFKCKSCGETTSLAQVPIHHGRYKCPECSHEDALRSLVKPDRPTRKRMFALEYWDEEENARKYRRTEEYDYSLYDRVRREFRSVKGALPFPRQKIPSKRRFDNRPISLGYSTYSDLFNDRQLYSLSLIYKAILDIPDVNTREYLLLAFSDSLASNNWLCAYAFGYRKLTPLFGLHSYRHISRPVEGNVWGTCEGRGSFSKCVGKVVRGKKYCHEPFEYRYDSRGTPIQVFTGERIQPEIAMNVKDWNNKKANCLLINDNAEDLRYIPANTIDLILTDPPYFNNLPYSELSDFYWVWLNRTISNPNNHWRHKSTPYRKGLLVSRLTQRDINTYIEGMSRVFKECSRILKPNGRLVFTFHHKDWRAWVSIASSLISGGFEVVNVFPLLSEGKSGFHSAPGNIKWDCVLVCRPIFRTSEAPLWNDRYMDNAVRLAEMWSSRLKKCRSTRFRGVDRDSLEYASLVMELTKRPLARKELIEVFMRFRDRTERDAPVH